MFCDVMISSRTDRGWVTGGHADWVTSTLSQEELSSDKDVYHPITSHHNAV